MHPMLFFTLTPLLPLVLCHPTTHSVLHARNDDDAVSLRTNITTSLTESPALCAESDDPQFLAPKLFNRGDCRKAYAIFHQRRDNPEPVEFLNSTVSAVDRGVPQVVLPMKWVYKTCTLAFVMHGDFELGVLPFESRDRWVPSDISTFARLGQATQMIDIECLRLGKSGWYAEGTLILI